MDVDFWIRIFLVVFSLYVIVDVLVKGRQDGITYGQFFEKYFVGMRLVLAIPLLIFMIVDMNQHSDENIVFIWDGFLIWIKYFFGYMIVFTALNELVESFQNRRKN